MRDELLGYYERELSFIRRLGAEFAETYPKIAGRLALEPDKCDDPHVERLIEAFAFLAGRVRLKIDDEYPEVTESFLNVLYPNLLAPVPSMSIVQFVLDPGQVNLQTGHTVPKGATLSSRSVGGTACRFRTGYPVRLWPLEVRSARFELPVPGVGPDEDVRTVLRLELKTFGGIPLSDLREKISEFEERPLDRLRFYLSGEGKVVHALYEHLNLHVAAVELRPGGPRDTPSPVRLPSGSVQPVGFARDEGLLPFTERSFLGYRLLQEYFAFPEKFLFVDLVGLDRAARDDFGETLEVLFHFKKEFPLERSVNAQTFRLHCTPIVNLFRQIAEPIRLTHLAPEYRVVPDVRRQDVTEVWSVDGVTSSNRGAEKVTEFAPFYSFKHGAESRPAAYWYASRRPSERKDDEGTDVTLTLVDLGFNPVNPEAETVVVETTCTNRDLPARLPFDGGESDFQLEGVGVYTGIRCLRKPTRALRIPLRRGLQWRLVSHLTLNVLSVVEGAGAEGPEPLREILRLYDYADSSVNHQQIAGLTALTVRRVLRAVGVLEASFVRGLEVSVELDEQQFIGSGVFLFAQVLERFLGLYASVNSFSQLVVSTRQREGVLKCWPPRSGEQIVL